jgi:hypothetical protein
MFDKPWKRLLLLIGIFGVLVGLGWLNDITFHKPFDLTTFGFGWIVGALFNGVAMLALFILVPGLCICVIVGIVEWVKGSTNFISLQIGSTEIRLFLAIATPILLLGQGFLVNLIWPGLTEAVFWQAAIVIDLLLAILEGVIIFTVWAVYHIIHWIVKGEW